MKTLTSARERLNIWSLRIVATMPIWLVVLALKAGKLSVSGGGRKLR